MYPAPRPTIRDRLAREYTSDERMTKEIYDGLLREGKIQPMISKKPVEASQVIDPRYYDYHQVVTHPTDKCYTLKNSIQE